MLNLFLIFELMGFGFFTLILIREILQRNKYRVFEILSCAVFGVILEIGDTYIAHTYYYSSNFLIQICNVPVAIGLGWAVIIYCAMLLSDQYNLPWKIRPFMDALTALVLDLSMDAVAIRLGFWSWAIPLNEEWYGVPFENLIGWVFVVFTFSFLMRFIRTLNPKRILTKVFMVLSPFISYAFLVLEIIAFIIITVLPYQINNWRNILSFISRPDFMVLYNPNVQLWKLIILLIILTELVNIVIVYIFRHRQNYNLHFDLLSFSIVSLMHLFFLFSIFYAGIYLEMPIFIFLSLFFFFAHCLLHVFPYFFHPTVVYFFKKTNHYLKKHEKKIGKIIEKSLK